MDLKALLENSELKSHLKSILYPLANTLYNELYIYIWLICFYNIILILLLVGIFALLLHTIREKKTISADMIYPLFL